MSWFLGNKRLKDKKTDENGRRETKLSEDINSSERWFQSQAQTARKILEQQEILFKENQAIMTQLKHMQETQKELNQLNKLMMSTFIDYQKSLKPVDHSPIHRQSNRPQTQQSHISIEPAHNFTIDKFASTFETLRRTSIPSSHALCFYYASIRGAHHVLDTGNLPVVADCGGVPLSMLGPDDTSEQSETISNWATELTLDSEEVVFVLAVPMKLLWAFPRAPMEPLSLETKHQGPYRVLPSRLVLAASESHALPIRQIVKRAYYLVDPKTKDNFTRGIGNKHHINDNDDNELDEFDDDNDEFEVLDGDVDMHGNTVNSARYNHSNHLMDSRSLMSGSFGESHEPIEVVKLTCQKHYGDKMSEVRQYCSMNPHKVLLYHYTSLEHARLILQTGLRMSTQGQGDGGVYFSLLGPACYGYGATEESKFDFEGNDFESRLIIDCYGKARLHEFYGKGYLTCVLVCAIDQGILEPAPGERTNALMVPKEIFETLGHAIDGNFYLPSSSVKAALNLDTSSLPQQCNFQNLSSLSSTISSVSREERDADFMSTSTSSMPRAPSMFSSVSSSTTEGPPLSVTLMLQDNIKLEIKRDLENALRAKAIMKKLKLLSGTNSLAPLPFTVPELPSAFLPRFSVLEEIKQSLLPSSSSSSAASTSSSNLANETSNITKRPSKNDVKTLSRITSEATNIHMKMCVIQGMGGMGKSTLVASIAHDHEVRSVFDKIVWVTVGQSPDIHALQESIHLQLTGKPISDIISSLPPSIIAENRRESLRKAASKFTILLVLDDVWSDDHAKELNFLECAIGNALLISTRIRNLIKGATVTNIKLEALDKESALSLLLAKSGIEEEVLQDMDEGNEEEYNLALEVVELTGCLPLTLAIASGLIESNGGLTVGLVEMMKEDRLQSSDDSSLDNQLITTSLVMFKGKKHEHLALVCFLAFAAFPEDCNVPSAVFDVLAPLLVKQAEHNHLMGFDSVSHSNVPEFDSQSPVMKSIEESQEKSTIAGEEGRGTIKETALRSPSTSIEKSPSVKEFVDSSLLSTSTRPIDASQRWKTAILKTQKLRNNAPNKKSKNRNSILNTIHRGSNDSHHKNRNSNIHKNSNKDILEVRKCLTELVRVNLCSGSSLDGFNIHDIVREYAVARYGEEALRRFHLEIVDVLLTIFENFETAYGAQSGSIEDIHRMMASSSSSSSSSSSLSSLSSSLTSKKNNHKDNTMIVLLYIYEHLKYHMSEVLSIHNHPLPAKWLYHPSLLIQRNLATALDLDKIKIRCQQLEKENRFLCAAKVLYLVKHIAWKCSDHHEYISLLKNSLKLCQKEEMNQHTFVFEINIILIVITYERERLEYRQLVERLRNIIDHFKNKTNNQNHHEKNHEISQKISHEIKFTALWAETQLLNFESRKNLSAASENNKTNKINIVNEKTEIDLLCESIKAAHHTASLAPNKSLYHYLAHYYASSSFGWKICLYSENNPEEMMSYVDRNDSLREAIDYYQFNRCHSIYKSDGKSIDYFLYGNFTPVLALYYEDFEYLLKWSMKALPAFESSINIANGLFSHIWFEIYGTLIFSLPILFEIFGNDSINPFLSIFKMNKFELIDEKFQLFWNDPGRGIAGSGLGFKMFIKLLVFVIQFEKDTNNKFSNEKTNHNKDDDDDHHIDMINKEDRTVESSSSSSSCWIPTPQELIAFDCDYFLLQYAGIGSCTSFGLKAYFLLKKYNFVIELATLGIKTTKKIFVKVYCYCMLGRVYLKQGLELKSTEQFNLAMESAANNVLPYLQTMVKREKNAAMLGN